jgi:hypothetical protein
MSLFRGVREGMALGRVEGMGFELCKDIAGVVERVAFVVRVQSREGSVAYGRREREECECARRAAQESATVECRVTSHARRDDCGERPASSRPEMNALSPICFLTRDIEKHMREFEGFRIQCRARSRRNRGRMPIK